MLVTGGYNGSFLSSAELYDPANNTWSAAAPMTAARYLQTATLLANGRVLVTGGHNGSSALSSAELYDPSSNSWSNAGFMSTARYLQAATLLANGEVLVTGGWSIVYGGGAQSSSDLYVPDSVAPTITTQPVSQTLIVGQTVSFTAAADGTPTPTVQWQVSTDGGASFSNIAGATSTTLTFTVTVAQSGNEYRAVFTNSAGTVTSDAATLTVNPAAADHLLFLQQPTDTAAGQTIRAVIIEVVDQFGNVVTTDNTDTITLSIGTNPSGGTLSGTLTLTVVNGVATFSDLSIDLAGSGYTLHAMLVGDGLPDIDSDLFNIT